MKPEGMMSVKQMENFFKNMQHSPDSPEGKEFQQNLDSMERRSRKKGADTPILIKTISKGRVTTEKV
jgi:hypothetical protein